MRIYNDDIRCVEAHGSRITITSRGKKLPEFDCFGFTFSADARPEAREQIRAFGDDPMKYGSFRIGPGWVNAPLQLCEAIRNHATALQSEVDRIANLPENVERRRVDMMFARAESRRDYPGEYFPMLIDARAALAAWREKYPQAAQAEHKAELLAEAVHEESIANGALVYDADGWLDQSAREARHAEHMRKAATLRKEAENA